MMDSHTRQKILNPFSLRLAQVFFDVFRTRKVITNSQKEEFKPFFIIGSGRSGTTLLRSILQKHSEINIPPESMGRIPNCVKKYYRYGGLDWDDLVEVILGEFSSFDTFDFWNLNLDSVRIEARNLAVSERSLAHIIHLIYQAHIRKHKPGASVWGDKSPFNTLRLKWIERAFPSGRYIHIIRDGRDVVSSYLKAELLESVDEAANRWKHSLDSVSKFSRRIAEHRLCTIHYESLVKDPEQVARKLCNFLGFEYEPEMIKERAVNVGDEHLEHMQNVRKPITSDSVGKWKENLNKKQREQVHKALKRYLITYGYLEE